VIGVMNTFSRASQPLVVVVLCVVTSSQAFAQEEAEEYPDEVAVAPDGEQEPFAEPDGTSSVPAGLELFRQAQERYDQGRYQEAVGLLLQLLELDPSAPDIYYNIALAYEHLTDYDQALFYLDQYREFDIGEEERARVERMMTRIRGAQEHAPPGPEPTTETRVVVQRFGRADAPFWAMVASTVLFFGGAAVTGALALDWNRAAGQFVLGPDGDQEEHQYWVDVANTLALVTDVLIGVASATALAGLLLYVLRTHEVEQPATTETSPGSGTDDAQSDEEDIVERRSIRRRRAERRRRSVPRVQVGVGAVIMGWEL
jgi:tetratricopeptide (TPR) repeat protein